MSFFTGSKTLGPDVMISAQAHRKMADYARSVHTEISGLGVVAMPERHVLLIEDVFILNQQCSPVLTRLRPNALLDYMAEAIGRGEDTSRTRLWWHSHADMGTFWSEEDDRTIEGFGTDWLLSVVTNRHGKLRARFDAFRPVRLTYDHLDVSILPEIDEAQRAAIEAEVKEKVRPFAVFGRSQRFPAGPFLSSLRDAPDFDIKLGDLVGVEASPEEAEDDHNPI